MLAIPSALQAQFEGLLQKPDGSGQRPFILPEMVKSKAPGLLSSSDVKEFIT